MEQFLLEVFKIVVQSVICPMAVAWLKAKLNKKPEP